MSERKNPATPVVTSTRRQMMGGLAIGIGGLAGGSEIMAKTPLQTAMGPGPSALDKRLTSLHQEVWFSASPQRVYEALLDSKQFAAFTGMTAEIDSKEGGAFTTFGGLIGGRNVELIPNKRIVQAWRPTHWDPGVYSIVRFELTPQNSGALLVLDHTGFPEGEFDSLSSGWKSRYWDPLAKFLG